MILEGPFPAQDIPGISDFPRFVALEGRAEAPVFNLHFEILSQARVIKKK